MRKIFVLAAPAAAFAAALIFTPDHANVAVGDRLDLQITLDPQNEKIFTAEAAIDFPADILEVASFSWSPSWAALSAPGYDQIDNLNGVFLKAAGYPHGTNKPTSIGVVTFKAKKAGTGAISAASGSLALNAKNSSALNPPYPSLSIVVSDAAAPAAPVETVSAAPAQPTSNTIKPSPSPSPPPAVPPLPAPVPSPAVPTMNEPSPPTNSPAALFDVSVAPATAANNFMTSAFAPAGAALIAVIFFAIARRRARHNKK